eukprot:Gb_22253 [translate_table: standard]
MTGRNIVKETKMKKMPVARSSPKYMMDFPEGTVLAADWKFPGKSRTPFDTMLNVPMTVSFAVLSKGAKASGAPASRSPVAPESSDREAA